MLRKTSVLIGQDQATFPSSEEKMVKPFRTQPCGGWEDTTLPQGMFVCFVDIQNVKYSINVQSTCPITHHNSSYIDLHVLFHMFTLYCHVMLKQLYMQQHWVRKSFWATVFNTARHVLASTHPGKRTRNSLNECLHILSNQVTWGKQVKDGPAWGCLSS